MPWPTPQDYNEAVQNPNLAFTDAELRSGQPELNQLGLPRPISGGFACVYRIQCPSRVWAARCFMSETTDQQERYAAIECHLSKLNLPYTVRFGYQTQGIKVKGQGYPLLKMEWVKGVSLSSFVASNLSNPAALRSLADKWMQMLKALHGVGISHGDLQHGNVLVVGGELRLIDYDGMFVPELNGRFSNEVGHRNYQHPHRTNIDFGPYLDNFAGWAIYATLVALSEQPDLWHRHNGGDECLLFRRADFEQPHVSAVFRDLTRSSNANVRVLGEFLARLSVLSILDVPDLDVKYETSAASTIVNQDTATADGWWTDYIQDSGSPMEGAVLVRQETPDVQWIIDGVASSQPLAPANFLGSFRGIRILLGTSVIAVLVTGFGVELPAVSFIELSTGVLGLLALYAFIQFRRDPILTECKAFQNSLSDLSTDVGKKRSERKRLEEARNEVLDRMNAAQAEWTGLRRELDVDLQKEVEDLQTRAGFTRRSFDERRRAIADREGSELRVVQAAVSDRIAALDRQISGLSSKITDEKERTLRSLREGHVKMALLRYPIKNSSIQGIGQAYVERLADYGFFTAADLNRSGLAGVPGIGPKRLSALTKWRDSLKQHAEATAPAALPYADATRIEASFGSERRSLVSERKGLEEQSQAGAAAVRSKYAGERSSIEKDERNHRESIIQHEAVLRDRHRSRAAQLDKGIRDRRVADQASVSVLTEKLREFDKSFAALQWRWAKKEREGRRYAGLTFWNFLRKAVWQ